MTATYRVYKYFYANTKMSRARFFNNPLAKRFSFVSLTIFGSIIVTALINNILFSNKWSYAKNKTKYTLDFKYILLWSKSDFAPFTYFGRGQQKFLENNCSINNCYVTDDRHFFGCNIMKFDAVAFNVRNLGPCENLSDLPQSRSPHQKYIFFASEPADNYPICNNVLDGFFNWTSTYRLDSDIPAPYMRIRNIHGDIVGPKLKMEWLEDMYKIDKDVYSKIQNKSKVAAWFVSNCNTQSVREKYAAMLHESLKQYGMKVDVFGDCGTLECPRSHRERCDKMLERDYYFYLAMENTRTPDYVTEKVLTGLQNYVVPIVYGGAHYSR